MYFNAWIYGAPFVSKLFNCEMCKVDVVTEEVSPWCNVFYLDITTITTIIAIYNREESKSTLISISCRDQTISTLISIYYRDETNSTLISIYYRDETISTLISIYYRDETISTLISIYCRDEIISTLISMYCRDETNLLPWWNNFYLHINLLPSWNKFYRIVSSRDKHVGKHSLFTRRFACFDIHLQEWPPGVEVTN